MSTKSREYLYCISIKASAEAAANARREVEQASLQGRGIQRMLGYKGPAQPSPTLGDALNAGFGYLEVRCLGCDTHQTVDLTIVRRPKATPVHELERYLRCDQLDVDPAVLKASTVLAISTTLRAATSGSA